MKSELLISWKMISMTNPDFFNKYPAGVEECNYVYEMFSKAFNLLHLQQRQNVSTNSKDNVKNSTIWFLTLWFTTDEFFVP